GAAVIRVANAPVSYGAFEITVGVLPNVPGPEEVLAAIAQAGYVGTEFGPPGYLGDRMLLRERFERYGLELAGAYIPIRLSEPEHWDEDLAAMELTLDLLSATGTREGPPVLADAGSPERAANPGRAANDRSVGLDDAGWSRLAEGVGRAIELARANGFEPTFHPHAGTYVEARWEIERLLELAEVGLLIDTGHLLLGGCEPVQALRDWRERVNHVHVKDVKMEILRGAIADGADMPEVWRRGVFCELGEGDVDLDAFIAELQGYSGWLVVEQDWVPGPTDDAARAIEAQARNRAWLVEHAGL
ncbi:MAG: TIM barrel protein, partial [Gaiellaceae bacterium]